jgi:hypothetical protein
MPHDPRWGRPALCAPTLPFLLWACTSHSLEAPLPLPVQESDSYYEVNQIRDIDLLFMVDDSPSMGDKQANLRKNFPALIAELQKIEGGLPDVHIAVVTSDLGAGPTSVSKECRVGGDRGVFHADPACGLDAEARFMVSLGAGRTNNFRGDISDVFSCLADVKDRGCGFEHQLQAVRVALYESVTPENRGFLRPDAYLGIIMLSDEDDCSANLTSDLFTDDGSFPGTAASFRCAQVGHLCDGKAPPVGPFSAPLASCTAAPAGRLIAVDELVASIRALKKDPDHQIIVSAITGKPDDDGSALYRYGPAPPVGELDYLPICQGANGKATAPLRTRRFVEAFAANGSLHSICADDFRPAMSAIGSKLRTIMARACLDAPPADTRPDQPALQPQCIVTERSPGAAATVLPACSGANTPCWSLLPDQSCAASGFKVSVDRGGVLPPPGTEQTVKCLTCARPDDPRCQR